MISIFEKFSNHSKDALKSAFNLALNSGHKSITPKHVLYGLSEQKGSIAFQILDKAKIKGQEIKDDLQNALKRKKTLDQIGLDQNTKKILERAFLISGLNKHRYIGTEHLLASLIVSKDESIIDFFRQKNINAMEIKKQTDMVINSTSKFPDLTGSLNYFENQSHGEGYLGEINQQNTALRSALDLFATNLTDKKIQINIDPVIGREEEINRLIQILSRRNKNNPLLLGDPGVGKTAIVEGLAKKINEKEVPEILLKKSIYSLDLSLVVAGTSFRGEFENRIKQILNEVKQNDNIILFIDEIHNIIGAGSANGSMDAANILKPALARGEIRCIGATTPLDYKKHIESDPALERRFQTINISQPDLNKTIEILKGIRHNYEIFHQVKIDDKAIITAAQLSQKYITDRFLPDKAIDLIDEASSAIKIKKTALPQTKEIEYFENELSEIEQKKIEAIEQERFNIALRFKQASQEIKKQINVLKESLEKTHPKKTSVITEKDIALIVSKITGIPTNELILSEKKKLLNLEKMLSKKIIGQDNALKSLAEFIRRSRAGVTNANRPIGSFMFLGPSGVGKTELAKVLAETVFSDPHALIKIDMSEFAESFNASKLIGAPAGYIGYKDGTKLTDEVKRKPYSVVLFDEIEKAHPQIFNLMLQILEDGYLTDGSGKKIDFKNTIIIMTSNLGSNKFNQQAALGFQAEIENTTLEKNLEQIEREVLKQLKDKFPPEFLDRLDKTIVFKPLDKKSLEKIAKLQLNELKERLENQGFTIELMPKIAKEITSISYSPESGARAIRKNIQNLLENMIAKQILSSKGKVEKIKIESINR